MFQSQLTRYFSKLLSFLGKRLFPHGHASEISSSWTVEAPHHPLTCHHPPCQPPGPWTHDGVTRSSGDHPPVQPGHVAAVEGELSAEVSGARVNTPAGAWWPQTLGISLSQQTVELLPLSDHLQAAQSVWPEHEEHEEGIISRIVSVL